MAVGKSNKFPANKSYSARLTLKDGADFLPIPEFRFQGKDAAGEYKDLDNEAILQAFGVEAPIREISGDLVAVDTRTGEYDKQPIYNVTLGLRDSSRNEIIFAQFVENNNLGRSVANRLLNLKAFENVQFGLYSQVNRETKKTYAAAALRQGDSTETIKFKYDPKTAPELQPRTFEGVGGKLTKDWTKVDSFLFGELTKLGESLRANRAPAKEAQKPVDETPADAPQAEEEQELKPPF